jgi:hypothetical protein
VLGAERIAPSGDRKLKRAALEPSHDASLDGFNALKPLLHWRSVGGLGILHF